MRRFGMAAVLSFLALLVGCASQQSMKGYYVFEDDGITVDYYAPFEADSTYHYLLYNIYRNYGDQELALEHFQKSIGATKAPSAELLMELSALYSVQGDQQQAISTLEQAIQINSQEPDLYKLLSMYYYQDHDYLRAREAMYEAISFGQSRGDDYLFYAEILEKIGDYEAMIQALEELREVQTDNYVAHYSLGLAYSRLEKYEKAIESIERAIDIRGGNTLSYRFSMARIALEMGDVDQAQAYYYHIYEESSHAGERSRLGYTMRILDTLLEIHNYDLLREFSLHILEDNPQWLWATEYCALGTYGGTEVLPIGPCYATASPLGSTSSHYPTMLVAKYLLEGGAEHEQRLVSHMSDPDYQGSTVRALKPFIDVDAYLQRFDNAPDVLRVLEAVSDDRRERITFGISLGGMLGDVQMQYEYASKLYSEFPDYASILQLGWAYYELGDVRQALHVTEPYALSDDAPASLLNFVGYLMVDERIAIHRGGEYIRRAIDQEGDNPYYIDSLAWFYYRNGDYVNARIFIERAIELLDEHNLEPDDSIIYDHAGDIYRRLGDDYRAFSWYVRSYALGEDNAVLAKMRAIRHSLIP
ncbi:tetratricopeptide repeat protein [Desulfurispira natronophila]|uniref:Tetratricopeptide (TPR) repeat protein n=1 Tax=Desulfurispira natronophila TaxID=682562 RepID=A0A7W7Y2Q8_9BACT|nr:tetratricopeptide repeat protein [Desulfurispira natronophila]MBB5020712.1 tetratricopeptide (TPR) repeat protein [Desulfurispira natronophila]